MVANFWLLDLERSEMTVSITLTDLVIRQIILDYDLARVHVVYDRVDADGKNGIAEKHSFGQLCRN